MTPTTQSTTSTSKGQELLSNGGEMGALIRSFDWEPTPLGGIENWPVSLITTVNIILNAQFPMVLWWGDHLIQFYNNAFRPILGVDGKHPKALGQRAADCWPETWAVVRPLIDQVLNGEDSVWNENELIPINRNGKLEDVYWTYSYSAVKIEDGSIGGILIVCMETTGKFLNLKLLQESEDQLRFAIEATELGTFDFNPLTHTFKSNKRLKEWFGLPANAEVDISYFLNAVAEQDKQRVMDAMQTALQYTYGGFYNIEYHIIHPVSKQERIVKVKGRAWFNDEKIAYRFNGTVQDITEQIAATNKMLETENFLRTTAERLQLALEAGRLGSYELNLETGEILCNQQCKINYGTPENELLSMEKLALIILPEDREMVQQKREEAIAKHELYNIEYRIQTAIGDVRWVKVFGKTIYDELDRPIKIVGVTQDISEQKFLTEEWGKQKKSKGTEAIKDDEILEHAPAVITPDLKEPAHEIEVYTAKLKEELAATLSKKGINYLEQLEKATGKIFSIIDSLFNYSSFTGHEPLSDRIDLNEVIDTIESDIGVLIQQKEGVLEKHKLPVIQGSNVLVYQLFYNLLSNSFKFSKKELKAVVSISSSIVKRDELEFVKITVKDNGIGFAKKYIPKLFTAFSKLPTKEKYEGSGLGLALCKKIVERHGGSIIADGKENEGAVFTVLLPLKQF